MSSGNTAESYLYVSVTANDDGAGVKLLRDSTLISYQQFQYSDTTGGAKGLFIPPSSIRHLDTPSAGTYVYKAQGCKFGGTFAPAHIKLFAYELP